VLPRRRARFSHAQAAPSVLPRRRARSSYALAAPSVLPLCGTMACAALASGMSVSWITLDVPEAQARLRRGFFDAVIDVRRRDEWESGHLANATFIESLQLTQDTRTIDNCTSCNIALYCRTGRRSKDAATVLEAKGFTSVFDVLGVTQWTAAGAELVQGASQRPTCGAGGGMACSSRTPVPPPASSSPPFLPPSLSLPPARPDEAVDETALVLALAMGLTALALLVAAAFLMARRVRQRASPFKDGAFKSAPHHDTLTAVRQDSSSADPSLAEPTCGTRTSV